MRRTALTFALVAAAATASLSPPPAPIDGPGPPPPEPPRPPAPEPVVVLAREPAPVNPPAPAYEPDREPETDSAPVQAAAAQPDDDAREPPPDPPYETAAASTTSTVPEPWASLADCESGNWIDGGAAFQDGSARWDWAKPGTSVPPWGTRIHHGGLQFHPDTWTWLAPDGFPDRAYDATPAQQIAVAERVLDAQGWGAWPVCSRKIGLR